MQNKMALRRKPGRKKAVVAQTWGERLIKWHSLYKPALLAAAVLLAWFGQEQFLARHLSAGLWFWLGGAIFAGMAFWQQLDKLPSRLENNRMLEAGLLALILVIGLMARLWRLSEVPNGYFFDEAVNALIGQRIIQDSNYLPIFGPPDAPLPTLYHYFNAVALKLGGISAYATKFVPALLGTATVAMFYFLVRRMVSWPVALAAALLLALMRWHINFSRINFVGIATPMFGAGAAYFLLRGMETRNRWHMALSGLAVSLGLYTYYASNLVPLVLGPYMALQLAWDRNFLKEQWRGLLIFLAVSLVVFAPLGHFAITQSDRFFARNSQVLIFNHVPPEQALSALGSNIKTTLLMFNYWGDSNGRHNIPEVPMLDPLTGLLLGLGIIWALTHLNRRYAVLGLFWFLMALVPGFLTIEAPQGYRCIGAIIPIALLSAFGLERLWQGATELARGTRISRWLWVGLAVLMLFIGSRNLTDYFGRQAGNASCWSQFSASEAAMGNLCRELGPEYHTYISSISYGFPTINFLGYPHIESEVFQIGATIPANYSGPKNVVYCLLPIHDSALELLQYYYPGGIKEIHSSPFDFTLFTAYQVGNKEVLAGQGLAGHYESAAHKKTERLYGQRIFRFTGQDLGLDYPLGARWTGSIYIPGYDEWSFQLSGADREVIRIDGRSADSQSLALAQGRHSLEIKTRIRESGPPITLMWKRGQSGPWNAIPAAALSPRREIHGLAADYYRSVDWSGKPLTRRIDPLISLLGQDFPMSSPFSVRWTGEIELPVKGVYSFGTVSNESSWVYIDNKLLVENEVADSYAESSLHRLSAGRHRIRIDYFKKYLAHPRIILFWTPPGGPKQKVPYTALFPE